MLSKSPDTPRSQPRDQPRRVAIVRTMAEFSLDTYSNNLVAGLRRVRPNWEIAELAPQSFDRHSAALGLRVQKYYERFWRYPRYVRQQTADVVHIVEPCDAHIAYWLKQTGKQQTGPAVVVTCHDLANYYYPDNLKGSVQLPLVSRQAWLYSVRGMIQADQVVAVSAATARDSQEILHLDPTRITVIPNAVEPEFRPLIEPEIARLRQQLGLAPDSLCLLNVGSNHPRKNLIRILEAVAVLKDKGYPLRFLKAGAKFSDEQQQLIQEQGLEPVVQYVGKPDKPALVELYNAADLLVAPSLHEGFGLTLLEAMACGRPVITANTSAMPEVVGDAGVLVDPYRVEELVAAIAQLYHDPGYRQQVAARCLQRAAGFSWEATAEQVAQTYEQVLHRQKLQEASRIGELQGQRRDKGKVQDIDTTHHHNSS